MGFRSGEHYTCENVEERKRVIKKPDAYNDFSKFAEQGEL